jgi:peptidoglycan/xylan/chitin deacetylase (PgdA/CDA1 family)
MAVLLTFDFDAESVWLARDPENQGRLGVLSQGLYGAKRAVPKLLELLGAEALPATFFIPGWVAEHHTDRCKEVRDLGYEIGHHGYSHAWGDPSKPAEERADFDRGSEALERYLGVKPKGYRPPGGEITATTLEMLTEGGFLYNSNMLDDVYPYRHVLPDGRRGPVELPTHWSIGDANYTWNSIRHPKVIQTNEHIFTIWKDEFDAHHEWGALFNLVLHPQMIGRPSRVALLRRFIEYARAVDGVWFATCAEVAEAFASEESGMS